jgi:hypothetical protein
MARYPQARSGEVNNRARSSEGFRYKVVTFAIAARRVLKSRPVKPQRIAAQRAFLVRLPEITTYKILIGPQIGPRDQSRVHRH